MFRKVILSMFILTGMFFLAFCTTQQASLLPQPATANPAPQANMANPASVYCEQQGGRLELRQDASGGVAGTCIFLDGSECDEWAFFRGECKPGDSFTKPEAAAAPAAALRVVYFKDGQVMYWTEGRGPQSLARASTEQLRISDDG